MNRVKQTIPCSGTEALRWIRHLNTGNVNGALPMADSVFADIIEENITDEQTLRAALASRARLYTHTPEAAPDETDDARAAEEGGGDDEPW